MINAILEIDHKLSEQLRIPLDNKFLRTAAAFFAHSGDSWFWIAGLFIVWLATKVFGIRYLPCWQAQLSFRHVLSWPSNFLFAGSALEEIGERSIEKRIRIPFLLGMRSGHVCWL